MKKLLLFTFLFILSSLIIYPQWVNQNPVPGGNDLWSTFFVDDNTGWIVGSEGFIKKTTNAGNEWIEQNSGTTSILKSVHFTNLNKGWICGESGLILKTNNGGSNWISLTSGTTEHLSDIHFYDADTGYVVGFGGTIIKTTNGGSSWTSLSSGTTNDLYSMDFVDAFIGYAAGEVNDTSSVIKTTDGGATWIDKASGFPATSGYCLAVEFIDANTGFIGGSGGIFYKTIDGGDTWFQTELPLPLKQKEKKNIEQLYIYPRSVYNSIYFIDENNGWYLYFPSTTDQWIYRTTDGGITWQIEYFDSSVYGCTLLSIFVTQNGTGWAVGGCGSICLKEDSSSNWSLLFSGVMDDIYSIYFVNEHKGWASSVHYGNPNERVIYNTTNGGKIWKTQLNSLDSSPVGCFYFINELIGWAAGEHLGVFLRTTDGGENWIYVYYFPAFVSSINEIYFINGDTGWGVTDKIYKTTDGGTNWVEKSDTSGNAICFSDINNGWVCGPSGLIMRSTDGGETWNNQSSGTTANLNCIRFYDNNIGMCVGDGIKLNTTNGGTNWNIRTSQYNLNSIQYINSATVMINGFLYTTDGGNSWEPLSNGYHFTNPNIGWDWGDDYISRYSEEPIPQTNHFTKVWSGNPYLAMNLYITSATIDGSDLVAGDEIGIFDGDNCVGSVVLTEPIPSGGYVQVIASTDDPITPEIDGFVAGDTITYKFWDSNSINEIHRITPTYSTGDGNFVSQGSAVVDLAGIYTITEHIGLISGWNILSVMATPDDPDMLELLDPLITAEVLIKVQDETGNAVEELPPPIGWINNIGDWLPTEGYYTKIKPSSAATLSITGPPVTLPIDIPLTSGWNIMGYPVSTPQDALLVLEPLITAGQLIKVQDEAGNAVEELPPPIGWINNIGNFQSGEGYYTKVNTSTSLTLDEPVVMLAKGNDWSIEQNSLLKVTADHFTPIWTGNPHLAMNIYVAGADLVGGGSLGAGDEIGIFDGEYCVGAEVLSGPINPSDPLAMIASTDDPGTSERDGFIAGNTISYKFWLSATSEEITQYTAEYTLGNGTFVSRGTALVNFTNVLPVELVSFTADVKDSKVQLSWQTATEINNYGFEIERKIDKEEWSNIGFIAGHGNSSSPKEYSFTDKSPVGGSKFQYRLKQIDNDGTYEYTNTIELEIVPTVFALYQNYPNPFNPTTKIRYQLPKESKVVIKIYDILGAEVITLLNEKKEPGVYDVELNAQSLSSGTYIYRMTAGDFIETKKMVLLK